MNVGWPRPAGRSASSTTSPSLHGKGRKQRSLPLWRTTTKAVRNWLHLNPQLQPDSPLLPRRDGKPMTRANVAQRLKVAAQIASLKYPDLASMSLSPHLVWQRYRNELASQTSASRMKPLGRGSAVVDVLIVNA